MLRIALLAHSALVLVLLAAPAIAAEPGPGKTAVVTCKSAPDQKYSCYVPKAYTPKKAWPILYCFAPDANGAFFVQRYKNVCEERGWIVVGSHNSKNGPWEPIKAAIDAIWEDTEARFNLSKKMRYASGFSGGSRVSFGLAEMKSEFFAGVIGIGAGLSSSNKGLPKKELAVWLMCGETCFNRGEMETLKKRLDDGGYSVELRVFPGGHTTPQVPLLEEAVRWMDDQAAEKQVERFGAAVDEATRLADEGEPAKAWLGLTAALEKYRGVKERRPEAEKLRKKLEREAAVKPEVSALAKLEKARKWIDKNRARMEKSTSAKAQGVKKLREVVERYPGTRGAARAEEMLAKLEAE